MTTMSSAPARVSSSESHAALICEIVMLRHALEQARGCVAERPDTGDKCSRAVDAILAIVADALGERGAK